MSSRPSARPAAAGRLRRWLPAGLWAAAMLVATSWPNPDVPHVVNNGDKLVHAALYAILALLVAHAVPGAARRVVGAVAILAGLSVFGAADEWHQRFIPGRSASVDDWVADSAGAVLGLAAARARRRPQYA